MKIYLDNIIFSLQRAGGISVYWYELLKRMIGSGLDINLIERPEGTANLMRKSLAAEHENTMLESSRPLILSRYLPLTLKMEHLSIFHSSYYRTPLQKNLVSIVTVHDFLYEHGLIRRDLRKYVHIYQKKYAIENADGIICVSENTKKDLIHFYKGIDENKIKVIYHGASEEFTKKSNPSSNSNITKLIGTKYILYVGTRAFYKNFELAIKTVKAIPGFKLILAGGGILAKKEIELLNCELQNRYIHFDKISTQDLNLLYNHAFCLLYPSSYEGFGIPILEAMQAGCPVVTSNVSSIPEVCGNAGLMVNEITSDQFIEKINSLNDEAWRNEVIERGYKQACRFSWDNAYINTVTFYEEIYSRKSSQKKLKNAAQRDGTRRTPTHRQS